MNRTLTPWMIALALFVAGCGPQAAPPEDKPKEETPAPTAQAQPDDKTEGEAQPAPVLPENLKNGAYAYYGLGRTEPTAMKVQSGDQEPEAASQSIKLDRVEEGAAYFLVTRSGGLANLGETVLKLTEKGVFAVRQSGQPINPEQMELPANPKPGDRWKVSSSFELNGSTISQTGNPAVVRFEKLKLGDQTFDALLVEDTGTASSGGQKLTVKSKVWFVKDRGPMKMEVKTTDPQKAQRTLTVTAVP